MEESVEELPIVNLALRDPNLIIKKVVENRRKNYLDDPIIAQAFYRESIKKRRTYASLSEAVVDIYKYPIKTPQKDYIKLNRARKVLITEKLTLWLLSFREVRIIIYIWT